MNFINDYLFQEIVKNTTDAIVVTDAPETTSTNGQVIVFVNNAYETMTGYSREEVIGKSPKILQGPDTDKKELRKLSEALQFEKPGHSELINYKKNGEKFWTSISIFPIKGESPDIKYWVGIKRDITQKKNNQSKLAEAEQNLRHIVEKSTNMFYIHDNEGILTYVSPQSRKFLGCEPKEAERHWTDFVTDHPINEEAKARTNKAIITGKEQPPFELQLRKTDGTFIWVEANENPVVKSGKTIEIVGSLADITDRRNAEQNQRLLEGLADQAWAAIWVRDDLGNHVFVNKKFKSIFGLEDQTVIGKTVFDLFDSETARQFHDNDLRVINSGESTVFEERVSTAGGERYYETNSFPLRDIPGKGHMAGGFAIDITEQKENQQIIEKSLREKETLLMEIHHRVKNNLAIISGLLELELYEDNSKTKEEFVQSSQLRIQSMAKIHELLYQSESFSQISFKDYIEEMISTIRASIQTKGFDPQFIFNVDDVSLNINQAIPCGLILNELISNSLKHAFSEQKEGTIHVSLSGQHDKIILSVEDNGMGISKDFNIKETQSLGFTLIKILSEQLHADLTIGNTTNGHKCSLTFEKIEVLKGSASHIL